MEVSHHIFKKNGEVFRTLSFVLDVSEYKVMVFKNENDDLNLLTTNYFSIMIHLWMFIGFLIHLCWFCFRRIFSTNLIWPRGRLPSRVRKWGHWSGVCDMFGPGDEDTTAMSITEFWCHCCLIWTCFTLLFPFLILGM